MSTIVTDRRGIARKLRETGGPAILDLAAIADGEFLKRVGSDIVSAAAGGGGGGGALEYIASIYVGSDTPSVEFTGLDGDTDYIYEIEGLHVMPVGAGPDGDLLKLQINGADPTSAGSFRYTQNTVTQSAQALNLIYLTMVPLHNGQSRSTHFGATIFAARKGAPGITVQGYRLAGGSVEELDRYGALLWDAAGQMWAAPPNITELGFVPVYNDIGEGSEFHLYRRKVS